MKQLFTFILLFHLSISITAQLTTPPSGQNNKCVVTQYIGSLAHVTITYNSPDVTAPNGQDRRGKIWGQLVPYGMNDLGFGLRTPAPWRAGANENTTIEFSHDMEIQGQPIAAGTYGFHVIVEETGPWTIILSNNSTAWGSFFYRPEDDALRVEATPESSEYHEWLTFEFTDRQPSQTTCALIWEDIKLPFNISVPNMNELYLSQMEKDLENTPGFNWQSWAQAANFSAQNKMNLEKALKWADYAISGAFVGVENFQTLSSKANVLNAMDKPDEALDIMNKAVNHVTANSGQIHNYGRQLIAVGKADEALKIFKMNHERFKGAWPTEVGMMRGYSAVGQWDKAIMHAEIALSQAPDQINKDNIAASIERLKKKEDIN